MTIAPVTLGQSYTNVKAIANVNFNVAIKFRDVVSVNYAVVQESSKQLLDPKQAIYTMFETQDGETVVLSNEWIDPNSVVAIDSVNLVININNITTDDISKINNILTAMGYKPKITVINAPTD
jgi:hypothetical protein